MYTHTSAFSYDMPGSHANNAALMQKKRKISQISVGTWFPEAKLACNAAGSDAAERRCSIDSEMTMKLFQELQVRSLCLVS
jgi:hypothetical protein